MKLGSITSWGRVVSFVVAVFAWRAGYGFGGLTGALILSGLLLVVCLAVVSLVKAATPGDDVHGKVLEAEAAWWRTSPGLRFSIFAAVVWMLGAFFVQDSFDRNWQLVLYPAAGILAIYFGFRVLVVGPAPEQYAARVIHHVQSAEMRQARSSAVQASNDKTQADETIREMTAAQRKQAMDALIGKMKT